MTTATTTTATTAASRTPAPRRRHIRLALAAAALAALGSASHAHAQATNTVYYLDANGSTADFGLTAGSTYAWNGVNALFNPTNVGTGSLFFSDLVQNPATGGASTLFLPTAAASGAYTLEITGSRWLQRMDSNNTGPVTVTGAGTSPTLSFVSGGNNFFIGAQGANTVFTFDASLALNFYGPLAQVSAGSGRTLNLNGAVNRFDRGIFQANNGTVGAVKVDPANTSIVNTNGLVLNGTYGAAEVIVAASGNTLTTFASRNASNQFVPATLTAVNQPNLAQLSSPTANFDVNLANTNAYTLTSGTSNTLTAVYGIALTGDRQANALRFANTAAVTTGTTNLLTGDTGGYVLDLAGSTLSVNSVLNAQQPLTITNTGGAAAKLTAGSANELTFITARNVSIAAPIADAAPGTPSNLVLMGTRGGQQFFLSASNTLSGTIYAGNGTLNLANAATTGAAPEIVLNQATLRPQTAMALPQGVRLSPTTINVLDGTAVANAISLPSLTFGLSSRATLQNGQFTIPSLVFSTAGQANQLTVATGSSLSTTGGISGNVVVAFGTATSAQATQSLIAGPSTGWNGTLNHRNGTLTIDGSVTTGTLTAFGTVAGRLILNGTVTVQQQSFSDVILGEQTAANLGVVDINPGASLILLGTTGTKRPFAIANGSGADAAAVVNLAGLLSLDANFGDVGIGGNPFRTTRNASATLNINSGGTFSVAGAATLPRIYLGANSQISAGANPLTITGTQSGVVTVNAGGVLRTSRTLTAGPVGTGPTASLTGSLTLSGGTLQAFPGQSNTNWVTGLTRFALTDLGGTIDTNGQAMTLAQPLTNDPSSTVGGLTKSGAGTLTLSATNTFGGGVTVSAGTLSVPHNAALAGAGTAPVTFNGGTLLTQPGFGNVTRNLLAASGTSTLDVSSNVSALTGTLTGPGNFQFAAVGGQLTLPAIDAAAFTGELTLRGGNFELPNTISLTRKLVLGAGQGNTTVANVTGNLSSGSAATSSIFVVGDQSTASTVNVTGKLTLTNTGATNTNAVDGVTTLLVGTANLAAQTTTAALNVSGTGTLSYTGGIVEIGGSRLFSSGTTAGTLSVSGDALVDLREGGGVFLGNRAPASAGTSTGTLNLDGGTLRTARTITNGVNGGSGTVNFNGGTLMAGADNVDLIAGVDNALVKDGGAVFNDGGFANVSASQNLAAAPGSAGGIIKTGPGRVTLAGSINVAGNVAVASGQLAVSKPLSLPASTVFVQSGASFTVAVTDYASLPSKSALKVDSVVLESGARLNILATDQSAGVNHGVVTVKTLDLAPTGPGTFGAFLDLGTSDLIVKSGDLSAVRSLVKAWLAAPTTGLGSSVAGIGSAAHTTLAVFPNAIAPGSPVAFFDTYDGETLAASDVLVKYTYRGDTNLDGRLDGTDLANLLEGLTTGLTGWEHGDINYDGTVNAADLALFNAALPNQAAGQLGNGSTDTSGPGGAIPEPTSLALLLPLALPLTRRRR